jgi:hypothetical protein
MENRPRFADFIGHSAQRQFTQRGQIPFAKEVRQRLLDLLRPVDLSFS